MIYEKFEKEYREASKLYPDKKVLMSNSEYIAKRKEYSKVVSEITENFKLALFKEHNIETNPKREMVWSKAWEHGHSYGYSEVELNFQDFVELVK